MDPDFLRWHLLPRLAVVSPSLGVQQAAERNLIFASNKTEHEQADKDVNTYGLISMLITGLPDQNSTRRSSPLLRAVTKAFVELLYRYVWSDGLRIPFKAFRAERSNCATVAKSAAEG